VQVLDIKGGKGDVLVEVVGKERCPSICKMLKNDQKRRRSKRRKRRKREDRGEGEGYHHHRSEYFC
jgi:hypothetical protein